MYLEIRPRGRTRAAAPLALALALLFVLASGCTTESNTGNSPESANSNNAPVNAPPPANTSSAANTSASTAEPAGLSPTEVVRGYYEAGVRKDVAGVKKFLSRASLRRMEDAAKRQGKTLDQLFGEAAEMEARKPPPKFSNERIMGDKATVDIEAPDQPALTMPLVREDGEWKLVFGQPKSGATRR
jgi:hypothetical protein